MSPSPSLPSLADLSTAIQAERIKVVHLDDPHESVVWDLALFARNVLRMNAVVMLIILPFQIPTVMTLHPAKHNIEYDQILVYGDSLTQRGAYASQTGWVTRLQEAYSMRLDVVIRGFGGYNTKHCRHILPSVLRTIRPTPRTAIRLATIFLGANDMALKSINDFQHVPLSDYAENLEYMVHCIRDEDPNTRIVLITPPPVHEAGWAEHCAARNKPLDRLLDHANAYRHVCARVAHDCDVAVLDLWPIFLGNHIEAIDASASISADKLPSVSVPESVLAPLFVDGLHFSALGNELLANALIDLIRRKWPEMDPETMLSVLPHWDTIDASDIPRTLFRNERQ